MFKICLNQETMVRISHGQRGLIYGFVNIQHSGDNGFYLNIGALEFSERVKKEHLKKIAKETPNTATLGGVMAVYRDLRENYGFGLRCNEAGEFFERKWK